MGFQITRQDIEHGYDIARRSVSRVGRDYDGRHGKTLGKAVETVEVMGSAFLVGLASGRYGSLTVGGTPVPLDLAGSVVLHLANTLLDTGRLEPHVTNVANGVGAAWAAKMGVGVGTRMREKKGLPPIKFNGGGLEPVSVSGSRPQLAVGAANRRRLTEAELAGLAQTVR